MVDLSSAGTAGANEPQITLMTAIRKSLWRGPRHAPGHRGDSTIDVRTRVREFRMWVDETMRGNAFHFV